MRKLVLRCDLAPGDIVMLTAAVRDLHASYPEQFQTDVRTQWPELWENNPYITQLSDDDREIEIIDCDYPLVNRSNSVPRHFLDGFSDFLNDRLKVSIKLSAFKGDIHLSEGEKRMPCQVTDLIGSGVTFWIVAAGGKYDTTIKWWDSRRYQQVVDHFRGKIQFVQVGRREDYHRPLEGVIDLRGKTDLRQLVRLVHHAQGVLCPVTLVMHLAAAVEVRGEANANRPCVVIAGGREPLHWEAYPGHQFVHTIGALSCCESGGCWRSRTLPLGDGDPRDARSRCCVDVVNGLPRCMHMITAGEVIRRIELYFADGRQSYLKTTDREQLALHIRDNRQPAVPALTIKTENAREAAEAFIQTIPVVPDRFAGRGILICGGGPKYFPGAWVCINMLRLLGCKLPIQLWHLGSEEVDGTMKSLVAPLGVECMDGLHARQKFPVRSLEGWQLKPYAILHSRFREVLLLDADNVPVADPESLFGSPQFKQTGAIFWPDYGRLSKNRLIWELCGVPYKDEPEFESGQIVVDKERCWAALCLTMWYNENAEFFYDYIHGDKETFHMAFRRLNTPFSMPSTPIHRLSWTMCQHDFDGKRVFQHRNLAKWKLNGPNPKIHGFQFETECLAHLEKLRQLWSGDVRPHDPPVRPLRDGIIAQHGSRADACSDAPSGSERPLTIRTARKRAEEYIAELPSYPGGYDGRGIVICGGGRTYFTCAWVCVKMLRNLGCNLPVQFWYRGQSEMTEHMKAMLTSLGVVCIDAYEVRRDHPARILNGYELKPYSIIHSPFKEVLLLDADNVPVVDPEFLFSASEFKRTGAVFWPDFGRWKQHRRIWKICGVEYRDEPEFETGQILINKEASWRALLLTMWYNEHSDFYYQHLNGDKDTFRMAFRKLNMPYFMISAPVRGLHGTLCQHGFDGQRLFQHRNGDKWSLERENKTITDFWFEDECKRYLEDLRRLWFGKRAAEAQRTDSVQSPKLKSITDRLVQNRYQYRRIGFDERPIRFLPNGRIGEGAGECEQEWALNERDGQVFLTIRSNHEPTCRLVETAEGTWTGRWLHHEKMPVELVPIKTGGTVRGHCPPGRKSILFRAPLTGYTGYGLHAAQIVSDFQSFGYEMEIRAIVIEEAFGMIPSNVRHCIVSEEPKTPWELLLHPPGCALRPGRKTVFFTMWESTRLPAHSIEALNQAEHVIVPSKWNAYCFSAAGVVRPISVVPLGINTEVFRLRPMRSDNMCVFGAAGRQESGGARKGISEVIELFQRAFPNEQDVRLRIKVFPDCDVAMPSDPRIEIIRRFINESELADWFADLTCFVSASRGEGWGLMQHQALAIGRPLISTNYGGLGEFFTPDIGYVADFHLVPGTDLYAGCGLWAEPDQRHMIELMRQVYEDRETASLLGKRAAAKVSEFSWRRSNQALLRVLQQVGVVSP